MSSDKPWFVYMLECAGGALYVGISNNVLARVAAHNAGQGAKFTAGRRPVRLIYTEQQPDKSAAQKREMEIKGWRRQKKLSLVEGSPSSLSVSSG